ncbi:MULTISPECIES: hypothetical protein [Bacillus cereus group]|uniref:hypothetical protein n=1 Tax=Bacillus cereus group TaxID=86661 RepID=UPI001E489E98|nr:hypothetical protein [Bacillus paranthracis]MCC2413928.1 hypothetical protein [Bacillus paranthracis]MDK7492463.1 hypothetical protein [Bacillus paranthracis]
MQLTKQEQAVIIGTFITMLGTEKVNEQIEAEKLERMLPLFNELEDNTTPKQKREAGMSVLKKVMDNFLMTNKQKGQVNPQKK